MGCLILCIGSLHSLLRCSVEFTVLIYFIVNGTSDDGINANKPDGQAREFFDGLNKTENF
jgi:hypothetical protein